MMIADSMASLPSILNAFLDTLYRWQSFTSDPIGLLRNAQAIRMTLEMYREHIKVSHGIRIVMLSADIDYSPAMTGR